MPQVAVNQQIIPPASLIRSASGMIFWCLPLPPWLLLAAPGSWPPLGAPGCPLAVCFLLLAAFACSRLLLTAPGCSAASLVAPGCSWLLVAVPWQLPGFRGCSKLLQVVGGPAGNNDALGPATRAAKNKKRSEKDLPRPLYSGRGKSFRSVLRFPKLILFIVFS